MFSPLLINEIIKITCIIFIARSLLDIRDGKQILDKECLYLILYNIFGYIFYHIIFIKFIPPI